jgi:hypothetical protein
MALAITRLPYGLRDVKVATLDAAGVKGSLVDLPNAQTFEFQEETETQTLRGDDQVVAQRTTVSAVSWTLEAGGISFEAMTIIAGGTVSSTGTTPAVVKTWVRLGTDAYPDFYLSGLALSESAGDHVTKIHRAKANQISGSHTDQEFWVSHAEGTGIATLTAADVGKVWTMQADETALSSAP